MSDYYDEDGNELDPSEIDWSDKLLFERDGGGLTVSAVSGEDKVKRDNVLALVEAQKSLDGTDYIAAKAMDALLSCESIADLLKVLAQFRTEYAEKIAERESARERVREMQEAGASLDDLMAPFKS